MKSRQFVFTFLLLISILGGLFFAHFQNIFVIAQIECRVDEGACPDYLVAELNKNKGKSIFLTDLSQQAAKISSYVPSLHHYSIQKNLPNSVTITFQQAQEIYALHTSNKPYLLVNEVGAVDQVMETTQFAVVEVPEELYNSLEVKSTLDEKLHGAIASSLKNLALHHINYKGLKYLPTDELQISLETGHTAVLQLDQVPLEIAKLAYVLNSVDFANIKQPIKIIDVRFKYPILKG
jgi:cell division septal protein FtsQ